MKSLVVLSVSVIVLALYAIPVSAQTGGALTLETTKVVSQRLEKTISIPGDLSPFQAVNIHAKVSGFVESMPVDRGPGSSREISSA